MSQDIKGYDIKGIIRENKFSRILDAVRLTDDSPVVIKILKTEFVSESQNKRICSEFNHLKQLQAKGIIKAYELIPFEMSYFIVMEAFPSRSLMDYIDSEPSNLESEIKIAIQLAEAIGEVHKKNIIHKDVKPQNILINKDLELKLIDFGIATSVTREVQDIKEIERFEGTLTYISPEQSGRMNRPLDYRSDIYSLGATLYQLFTKSIPFIANTPMELIHLHISQKPTPPHLVNSKVPKALSNIIMKCLEKDAENRYKSAFGLKKDLEKCLALLLETGRIDDFKPGEHDLYDRYHTPTKIFGREKELALIEKCIDEVVSGNLKILTISGYSGIGKSSLVYESQKAFALKQVRYASAKFDQYKVSVPYYAITQVISILTNRILSESETQLNFWKTRFLEALGENGQVLVDLVPNIKLIIGEQPPLEELEPQLNESRFKNTLQAFLKSLLVPGNPLILMFDDFQWCDNGSLKILKEFLTEESLSYLLVIIIYRDNEVSSTHPLQIAFDELKQLSVKIIPLTLSPLPLQSVEQIILNIFSGLSQRDTKLLSQLVEDKTLGNPFFVIQLLKYLYEKEYLQFDQKAFCWKIVKGFEDLEISENVVEFLVQKIKNIDHELVELMKICSVMGNTFELDYLITFEEKNPDHFLDLIDMAQEEEFIFPKSFEYYGIKKTYRFMHDRIRQAFYQLIDEESRNKLHYKIGHSVYVKSGPEELDENIISIVNHLNYGLNLDLTDAQRKELLKLNIEVAKKVQASQAYSAAIMYLKNAISLSGADPWKTDYYNTISIYKNLAICYQLTGNVKEAEKTYRYCVENAKTPYEKIVLYPHLIYLLDQVEEYQKVFDCGSKAFELLDYSFNMHPSLFSFLFLLIKTRIKLKFYTNQELESLPIATDKRIIHISRFLASMGHAAYKTNMPLVGKLILSAVNLALKHGVTMSTSESFGAYGLLLSSDQIKDLDGSYQFGHLAMLNANRFPSCQEGGSAKCLFAVYCHHLKHPFKLSIPFLWDAYHECMAVGAIGSAGACLISLALVKLLTGQKLETTYDEINGYLRDLKKITAISEEKSLYVYQGFCKALMEGPSKFCPDELAAEVPVKGVSCHESYMVHYYVWNGCMLYLFDKFEEVKTQTKELLTFSSKYQSWVDWNITYMYYALALCALSKDFKTNKEDKKEIEKAYDWLSLLAKSSRTNYGPYALLVKGEICRLQNQNEEAVRCYNEAVVIAMEENNFLILGIASEVIGRYYISQNAKVIASYFMQQALSAYSLMGAKAKCEDLKKKYMIYLATKKVADNELTTQHTLTTHPIETLGMTIHDDRTFDIDTLIESSLTLSKEIFFDKLLESLMHLMIVHAGANKAFLILYEDGTQLIYSEIYTNTPYQPLENPIPCIERKNKFCQPIIDYVERTKTEILINDTTEKGIFANDPYIQLKEAKSIFCLPLLQKGALKGILYLENTEAVGAFTLKQRYLLSLLSSQMAISIENAQFYSKLEGKVAIRTKELNEKNLELQNALEEIKRVQEQLIQQEKLASLGLVTAGIAHELKNPLNFIINYAQISNQTLQDLMEAISKVNVVDIKDKEEIDLLSKDIAENLDVINKQGGKANNILKGMLGHFRHDSQPQETVNLIDLIDQAYAISYETFKKKSPEFNVTYKKNIETEIPHLKCYPGELTRVFINMTDNACYALLEKLKQQPFSPEIEVTIRKDKDWIIIQFQDNGCGISKEQMSKIFTPFFTTKPTGTGSGLGLSISYDIITKQHYGKMNVESEKDVMTRMTIQLPLS